MFGNKSTLTAALAVCLLAISPLAFAQGGPGASRTSAPSAAPGTETEQLVLQVGEQRVISSDNVRSYSEGTKGIVDIRLTRDATEFIVVALAPGTTTLLFLMMDGTERHYKITVVDPNAHARDKGDGTVEARDNIRLDFYFVQVDRNYGHQIGIGYPSSVTAGGTAQFDLKTGTLDSATAVITNQALLRLDMAQASGWAKVMRQAAVVTENGQKSSFSGGGEVNVAIQSALSTGIQKIPFGSVIEVEPVYDSSSGRIELRLHADISELQADTGSGVPGRLTSSLDTVVNLELGQSLILAGLTARSERSSKTGVPGLSQLPIIGLLFGSHSHAEDESENVVVIVPSVVDAISMQDRERLNEALRRYSKFSGDMAEVDFVPAATTSKPRRAPQHRSAP
ncbi:MAG TPA: pilus assembly protein N-terminal domain-containing protein [Polyangiaceae bacterium]|nr:pilus assembly protein N-terminal domain-containing protein [Polyangiaceae bacterium]